MGNDGGGAILQIIWTFVSPNVASMAWAPEI